MKVINGSFNVDLPPAANEVLGLYLTRSLHEPIHLTYNQYENRLTINQPPEGTRKGVWQLVIHTCCGCFITPVYLDCPAPALHATHEPTNELPPTIVCCDAG